MVGAVVREGDPIRSELCRCVEAARVETQKRKDSGEEDDHTRAIYCQSFSQAFGAGIGH
jgi:hypothetical protein